MSIINKMVAAYVALRLLCRPYVGTVAVFVAVLLAFQPVLAQSYRDDNADSVSRMVEQFGASSRAYEAETAEASRRHQERVAADRAAAERQADERQRGAEVQQQGIDRGERYWLHHYAR